MSKKLVVLMFALVAAAVASAPAPASTVGDTQVGCGQGYHIVVCGDVSFCCRNGVICWC